MNYIPSSIPNLGDLVSLFYDSPRALGQFDAVVESDMPPDYQKLLAHDAHMTVTVEKFHNSLCDVKVLRTHADESHYAREILLTRQADGAVVLYGIMRLRLAHLDEDVRREVESKQTPLGRILIQHNVLRKVELVSLWKLLPAANLCKLLNLPQPKLTYGRTALIYCDQEPAVELLEIVAPV